MVAANLFRALCFRLDIQCGDAVKLTDAMIDGAEAAEAAWKDNEPIPYDMLWKGFMSGVKIPHLDCLMHLIEVLEKEGDPCAETIKMLIE